jgi:acetyl esterase/lipase
MRESNMNGSVPGEQTGANRRRRRLPVALLRMNAKLTPKLFPRVPTPVKRALSGGRAVVIDGNTLDPTLQLFLAGLRLAGVSGMVTDDDVTLSRAIMRDTCMNRGGPSPPAVVDELSVPGSAGPIGVRRYRTDRAESALVFFHGGGYVMGDLDGYDTLCRRICHDAEVQVFSVDYRLAPEHPAPAAVEDCCAVYDWVAGHAAELGVAADRIAIGGDSAGGALAAVVAQWARDTGRPRPLLQVLLYPITEFDARTRSRTLFAADHVLTSHDMDFFRARYVGGSTLAPTDVRVSPLLAADLSGLAPALVVTAGFDPLRDEGERYAAALAEAGVAVDLRPMGSMTHGFMNFSGLGGGVADSVAEVVSTLRAHLRRVSRHD